MKSILPALCLFRILKYFGYIARRAGDNLVRLMVTGKIDRKGPSGRNALCAGQYKSALLSALRSTPLC